LIALTLSSAVLEGLTLAMLLPLLAVLGFGGLGSGSDTVTHIVRVVFDVVGLSLTLQTAAALEFTLVLLSAVVFVLQAFMSTRMQAEFVTHWQEKVFST